MRACWILLVEAFPEFIAQLQVIPVNRTDVGKFVSKRDHLDGKVWFIAEVIDRVQLADQPDF